MARRGLRIASRGALVRLSILAAAILVTLLVAERMLIRMPGESHRGPLPPLPDEAETIAAELRIDIAMLAGMIGPRHRHTPRAYRAAATHIEEQLRGAGLQPWREPSPPADPTLTPGNILAEIVGSGPTAEIVVIGAHYDTVLGSPGANDNASGVAATLAIARRLVHTSPSRTIRFAFFVDEEPPYFQTDEMGSLVYALGCRERGERIVAMVSLETMGWYSDAPGSQKYPAGLAAAYPNRGDFAAFVSNVQSRRLLREVVGAFRDSTEFPSEGGALPGWLAGIGWSDHWSFWRAGYPGLMVTDTAPFRYPHYHTPADTPDKIDHERLARVVDGMVRVVAHLAGSTTPPTNHGPG